jgi:uncharacterized protein with gpF-like domain
MPLNNTDEEAQRSALKDHARKIAFEGLLFNTLRPRFNRIVTDYRKTFAQTGNFPDITQHNNDIASIISKHYDSVGKSFSNNLEQQLGLPTNRVQVRNDTEISVKIHNNIEVFKNSQYIANTNIKQMHDSRNEVIIAAALAGLFLTNRQIANQASAKLATKYAKRLPLISMDNTQNAAEGAKQSEYQALIENGAVAGGVDFGAAGAADKAFKQWAAILDGKTRQAHAEADGQIVLYNQPYIVGGERLRFPRDTSLGASMGNVANCRCASVPVVR